MVRNLLIIAWLCIVTNYAYGANVVKQSIDADGVKIVVITTDEGDKLVVNNKEMGTSQYITVEPINPVPKDLLAAYIVNFSAGGSGTIDSSSLMTVSTGTQVALFDVGYFEPNSIHIDDKSIVMKFSAVRGRFDNSVIEPAQTAIYSKGKITIKKGKMK